MANLEETQESELDSILTELSMLEQKGDLRQSRVQTHSRSSSIVSGVNSTISTSTTATITSTERTDSPDNDSAFSDTVSLLSSESSASSGLSSLHNNNNNINISKNIIIPSSQNNLVQVSIAFLLAAIPEFLYSMTLTFDLFFIMQDSKSSKIQLALQKLEHASVRRLFVKAFTEDGSSKSLLVDERMNCGFVTKLLAGKSQSILFILSI